MKKWGIILIISAMCGVACSHGAGNDNDRPDPVTPTRDDKVVEQLADPAERVVTPEYTMNYRDCGVIMGAEAGGALFCIDTGTGRRVDFNPSAATLYIDNRAVAVTSTRLAKVDAGTRWWIITTATDTIFYVTSH